MDKQEQIKEYLENLDNSDLLSIYNEYASTTYDNAIYTMDEFDEICENMDASEIARRCFYGKFNPNDEYFIFNGYENFDSSDYLDDFIDFDDIANYIARNDEDFDSDEIREILDADKWTTMIKDKKN